ncbi:Transcription initiation factor TFIID subunit 4 [Liparis tanakae]|uniref:Transcription initiation factor TFIID subunit 4 n=1 Tax=Liparis tanakae TaxID=230148 RepID=A0A4Z2EWU4_9TELE|nr:Transcription initiation factor TFIID subunit 4 [Liparis tanakae]
MDASTASTDATAGRDPDGTLVASGAAAPPLTNHGGKVVSHSAQTFNGSRIMNSEYSGSGDSLAGATPTSGTGGTVISVVSKGPTGAATTHPASNSVIQTPLATPPSGVRPPAQPSGSGATLNGTTDAGRAAAVTTTGHAGYGIRTPLVNNSQPSGPVPFTAGSHIIKAEAPTITTTMQTVPPPPPPAVTHGAVRFPSTVASGPGGIRALTPQMLAPRLPQTSPGQPSIGLHNIQLPPGMVLVRSESGQLLMIPQQALAQIQAQAQAQAQGGMAPRTPTPTSMPPGQAPGNIIRHQVAPGAIRQGCPAPAPLPATTTLHRPPILQSSVGAAVPGITPRTVGQPAGPTVTSVTISKETMENVKKCKNFLSTLIKLASSGKQTTETAASVRELVKDLLEGRLEAEDFTSRLYKELNSSPQPYLVPFLKRSLPALRQLTPDSAAFIQQSQVPQPAAGPVPSTSPVPTTVVLGGPAARLTAPVMQAQQQRAMLKPQAALPATPMVTLRNQGPGRTMLGQQPVQLKALQPVPVRPELSSFSRHASAASYSLAQRIKLREAGGKDEDDINDVTSMAGVSLSEESANILATNSGLVGAVTHSCKDVAFLPFAILQRRMQEIGRRYGVSDLGAEVVNLVSHAAQQRLQNLLGKVSQVAQHRNGIFKEDDTCEPSSDVRAQLRFFEQLDHLEKQRKEGQEREILLKAAKVQRDSPIITLIVEICPKGGAHLTKDCSKRFWGRRVRTIMWIHTPAVK